MEVFWVLASPTAAPNEWSRHGHIKTGSYKLARDPRPCPNQGLGQSDPCLNLSWETEARHGAAGRAAGGGEFVRLRIKSQSLMQAGVRRELQKQSGRRRGDNGTDAHRETEPPQDRG